MSAAVPSAALETLLGAILVLGPFAFGAVEPWARAALQILCFALALGTFARGAKAADRLGAWLWLVPAGLAALAAAQASFPATDGPRPAFPFTAAQAATQRAVVTWGAYAALAWSVPRVLVTHDAARRFCRTLFGVGLAVAILGVLQAATSRELIYWTRPTARGVAPFGPYYNVDHAANLMALSLCLWAGMAWARLSKAFGQGGVAEESVRTLAAAGAAGALLAGAILFCRSEGAVLAGVMAAAGLGLLHAGFESERGRRLSRAGIFLALSVAAVLLAYRHVAGALAAGGQLDGAVSARFLIYADATRWFRDAPWFGAGLGSFASLYPAYQDAALRASVDHAHCDWIQAALESGLLGLLLALTAAVVAGVAGARAWWSSRSREMRAMIGGLLAAGLFAAFHSLFDFPFQIPANGTILVALAGALASAGAWKDKVRAAPRAAPPDASALVLAAACAFVACMAATRPAVAAWISARRAPPAARISFLARGLDQENDPQRWRRLGETVHGLGLNAGESAPSLMRYALGAAARSTQDAPFDKDALYLTSSVLWRLGRPMDAADALERSRAVTFAAYRPPRAGKR